MQNLSGGTRFKCYPGPFSSVSYTLWYQGEVCCLFADSNLGKSIYAVQIAAEIAETHKVLYFDFELSDKQFQLRYTNELSVDMGCKILIIDNLSYLCMTSEKGEDAGRLMSRLMDLKRKHELSILILAHTPKRQLNMPITQNDLAGSKKLYNFFDSVFAIGKSAKDENLRYIKQLKVRYGNFEYGGNNVIVCTIEKADDFLRFITLGHATESAHLKEITEEERNRMKSDARSLHSQGMSYREIGEKLGISKTTVERYCKS